MKKFLILLLVIFLTAFSLFYQSGAHTLVDSSLAAQQANNSNVDYVAYRSFQIHPGNLIIAAFVLAGGIWVYRKSN